ncbi:MAG: hypothetical protein AB7O39_03475 [Flavobacteriaceae bacterium]
MGLLDLPSPGFSILNGWLGGFLPTVLLVVVWAAVGAFISMELYRLLSPQARIARLRRRLVAAQADLNEFDGPFGEALRRIRTMLSLALRRVLLVLPATMIASLPVLMLLVWADTQYGRAFPAPGEAVEVSVTDGYRGEWRDSTNAAAPGAEVTDRDGARIADVAVPQPVPVIHKWRWWNTLIGNPAGYLPDEAPFERIDIALPRQELIPFGPSWLRGWEPLFFVSIFVFAFALKALRGIE